MKLLMISTDKKLFETGSEVALRQIEYAQNFEEMHIIVFAPKSFHEISLGHNVWVYPTGSLFKYLSPMDAIKLGRFIIERRGITNITTQDPFLTAMTGVSLKRRFGTHLEIQLHTDIGSPHFVYTFKNKIFKTMALSYLPHADHVRVVSMKIKEYLLKLNIVSEASKIEVRPIIVDVEKIKNTPVTTDLHKKYPQFDKIVLMASRLEKEKNINLALAAWPDVLVKSPRVGLVIVGKGSEQGNLQSIVDNLGIKDSVILEPWADQATLVSYYKTADLFLNTSLYEGYGMTMVEARAAGCKIVSTDVGVASEVGAQIVDWSKDDVTAKIVYSLRTHPNPQ